MQAQQTKKKHVFSCTYCARMERWPLVPSPWPSRSFSVASCGDRPQHGPPPWSLQKHVVLYLPKPRHFAHDKRMAFSLCFLQLI